MTPIINLECSCGFKVVDQSVEFCGLSNQSPKTTCCPLCGYLLIRRSSTEYTAATFDELDRFGKIDGVRDAMIQNSLIVMSRRRDRRMIRGDN